MDEVRDRGRKVTRCGSTDVWVWQGDITAAGTEAIVNAANNEGWLGSGVAGAIRRAAGDQVEAEAVAQATGAEVAATAREAAEGAQVVLSSLDRKSVV